MYVNIPFGFWFALSKCLVIAGMYSHMLVGLECIQKYALICLLAFHVQKYGYAHGYKNGAPWKKVAAERLAAPLSLLHSAQELQSSETTQLSAAVLLLSPGPHTWCFSCRFYIESISYLKDNATIELFFLNAKSCIYKVRMCSPCSASRWNQKYQNVAHKAVLLIRESHLEIHCYK